MLIVAPPAASAVNAEALAFAIEDTQPLAGRVQTPGRAWHSIRGWRETGAIVTQFGMQLIAPSEGGKPDLSTFRTAPRTMADGVFDQRRKRITTPWTSEGERYPLVVESPTTIRALSS